MFGMMTLIFRLRDMLIKRFIFPRAARSIVLRWRPVPHTPEAAVQVYRLLVDLFTQRLGYTHGVQKPTLGNLSLLLMAVALVCHVIHFGLDWASMEMSQPWFKFTGLGVQAVSLIVMLIFTHQGFMSVLSIDWSSVSNHPQQATSILCTCFVHCQLALFFLVTVCYFGGSAGFGAVLVNLMLMPGSIILLTKHYADQAFESLNSSELSFCLSRLAPHLDDDIKVTVLNNRMDGNDVKLDLLLRSVLNPETEVSSALELNI